MSLHRADSIVLLTELEQSQLSFLINHNNIPSLMSNLEPYPELCRLSESSEGCNSFMENATMGQKLCLQTKEMKCMKATLQEEIAGLQSDLEGRLCSIAQENTELRNMVATKEEEIRTLCLEGERAIFELTTFLLDGSRSLRDACGQVESITGSLPEGNARIAEHINMAVKSYMKKEETIQKLESSLEDAQKIVLDMELKVGSLKEATATLSAFQQVHNKHNEDSVQLRMSLDEKTNMLRFLENEVKYKDGQLRKAEKRADAAFLLVRWLSDCKNVVHTKGVEGDISIPEQDVQGKLESQTKFEEAHATVKEADFMLHALTKAYEDAKQLSVTRKQANENLMIERASLADEIQKLKSSICHKEEENQLLKDHINSSLTEMVNSVSLHEECFLQVQTDVEKKFVSIFSYVLPIHQEMISFTKELRTLRCIFLGHGGKICIFRTKQLLCNRACQ